MGNNCFDKNKKKPNFIERKNCTIYSLKEVEFFLCNFNKAIKSFNFLKIFK